MAQTMNDTIRRQAAIDAVEDWFFNTTDLRQPAEVLRCLPSAQRKGKWIAERYMDEVDSCFYTRYKCSECGRIVYDSSLSYCHCGADMREG